MSNLSDIFKGEILTDHLVSPTGDLYLALFGVDPADDGTGAVEVAGLGYNRIPVTFTAVVSSETHNNALLPFPLAQADWGSVAGWGLYDDIAAGQLKLHGVIDPALDVLEDATVTVPSAALSVSFPVV